MEEKLKQKTKNPKCTLHALQSSAVSEKVNFIKYEMLTFSLNTLKKKSDYRK